VPTSIAGRSNKKSNIKQFALADVQVVSRSWLELEVA
jgi:hypothetical protein